MKFTEELKQRIINHFKDISAEELYTTLVEKYKFPIYDFYSENYVKYNLNNKDIKKINISINSQYDRMIKFFESSLVDISIVESRNVTSELMGSSLYEPNEIYNALAA